MQAVGALRAPDRPNDGLLLQALGAFGSEARNMNFKSTFWGLLNVLARIFGLMFTAFGVYFIARGIYYLIQPEAADLNDTLGFSPSFRPFAMACVFLVVGVHFIRGEAHRPDVLAEKQPDRSTDRRTHSWWTGEPLCKRPDREIDT